ncbi:MAG: metal-sulfur cluster assembly factor [Patescibacteria group bacterium]
MTKNISPSINDIEDVLKEVYDPEFPLVDIFTLGLIYNIEVKKKNIYVLMTLTSPACPLGDMIVDMVKTAIDSKFP